MMLEDVGGTVFIDSRDVFTALDPSQLIYDSTVEAACTSFVGELASVYSSMAWSGNAVQTVGNLIKNKGLRVAWRGVPKLGEATQIIRFFEVEGLDGMLSLNEIREMVMDGTLEQASKVRKVTSTVEGEPMDFGPWMTAGAMFSHYFDQARVQKPWSGLAVKPNAGLLATLSATQSNDKQLMLWIEKGGSTTGVRRGIERHFSPDDEEMIHFVEWPGKASYRTLPFKKLK